MYGKLSKLFNYSTAVLAAVRHNRSVLQYLTSILYASKPLPRHSHQVCWLIMPVVSIHTCNPHGQGSRYAESTFLGVTGGNPSLVAWFEVRECGNETLLRGSRVK